MYGSAQVKVPRPVDRRKHPQPLLAGASHVCTLRSRVFTPANLIIGRYKKFTPHLLLSDWHVRTIELIMRAQLVCVKNPMNAKVKCKNVLLTETLIGEM